MTSLFEINFIISISQSTSSLDWIDARFSNTDICIIIPISVDSLLLFVFIVAFCDIFSLCLHSNCKIVNYIANNDENICASWLKESECFYLIHKLKLAHIKGDKPRTLTFTQ